MLNGLALPAISSHTGKFSLSYAAARKWNALPADFRSSDYSQLSAQVKLWLGHPDSGLCGLP